MICSNWFFPIPSEISNQIYILALEDKHKVDWEEAPANHKLFSYVPRLEEE